MKRAVRYSAEEVIQQVEENEDDDIIFPGSDDIVSW